MRTITIKGTGKVSARPDMIILSILIEERAMEYADAMERAAKRIEALEGAAAAMGFQRGELKTISFNVDTAYENQPDGSGSYQSVFAGYAAAYRFRLAFDFDSGRLAGMLSALAESIAAPELSIDFTVKEPSKLEEELLACIAHDAVEKAECLCHAAGVELGQLLSIDYSWGRQDLNSRTRYADEQTVLPMMVRNMKLMPNIEPDEIELIDTASFVWEIV